MLDLRRRKHIPGLQIDWALKNIYIVMIMYMLFIDFQVLESTRGQSKEDLIVATEQKVNVNHLDNIKKR